MAEQKIIPDKYEGKILDDTWSIFKIMGEFVEGYEKMQRIGPCVSIFGSARLSQESEMYKHAVETARLLTEVGFGVITGGGPGIMEAGNKGANEGNGKSVGLCISLPKEDRPNDFVDRMYTISFNYFFARKVMFVKYAQGFVVFPGGYGTLDEFFEALTLIQTNKISRIPIVLFGSEFWSGMVEWLKSTLVKEGTINESDLDLFHITDSPHDAVKTVVEFYKERKLKPNF